MRGEGERERTPALLRHKQGQRLCVQNCGLGVYLPVLVKEDLPGKLMKSTREMLAIEETMVCSSTISFQCVW